MFRGLAALESVEGEVALVWCMGFGLFFLVLFFFYIPLWDKHETGMGDSALYFFFSGIFLGRFSSKKHILYRPKWWCF